MPCIPSRCTYEGAPLRRLFHSRSASLLTLDQKSSSVVSPFRPLPMPPAAQKVKPLFLKRDSPGVCVIHPPPLPTRNSNVCHRTRAPARPSARRISVVETASHRAPPPPPPPPRARPQEFANRSGAFILREALRRRNLLYNCAPWHSRCRRWFLPLWCRSGELENIVHV